MLVLNSWSTGKDTESVRDRKYFTSKILTSEKNKIKKNHIIEICGIFSVDFLHHFS